jgi:hypothetical protein
MHTVHARQIGRGPGRWSRVLHYILAETLEIEKGIPPSNFFVLCREIKRISTTGDVGNSNSTS